MKQQKIEWQHEVTEITERQHRAAEIVEFYLRAADTKRF
jgi:hypothetical protein